MYHRMVFDLNRIYTLRYDATAFFSAIYFTRTNLRSLKILLGYVVLSPCIVTYDRNAFRWRFYRTSCTEGKVVGR
jgi:hypothetical protein